MSRSSPRIVLAVGVFDVFHIGHLVHLQQARRFGDVLIVGVTRDQFVNKGPGRPVFKDHQRSQIIAALAIVDQAVLVNGSHDALERIRPNVFVLGREYERRVAKQDEEFCKANFISIVFTNGPVYSSTKLLHHYDRPEQN